jgi:hypothetical protein
MRHRLRRSGRPGRGRRVGYFLIGGLRAVLATIREGVGALPKLARLHQERSVSLLDRQMGPGEYEYIYVLAYYSWLDQSPGDGPRFLKIGGNNALELIPLNSN